MCRKFPDNQSTDQKATHKHDYSLEHRQTSAVNWTPKILCLPFQFKRWIFPDDSWQIIPATFWSRFKCDESRGTCTKAAVMSKVGGSNLSPVLRTDGLAPKTHRIACLTRDCARQRAESACLPASENRP